MRESFPEPGNPEPTPSEEALPLRTQADWQAEVSRLEGQRDAIVQAMGEQAESLPYDPDFNFLLGKIQVAHEQLARHSIEEGLDKAVSDFEIGQ